MLGRDEEGRAKDERGLGEGVRGVRTRKSVGEVQEQSRAVRVLKGFLGVKLVKGFLGSRSWSTRTDGTGALARMRAASRGAHPPRWAIWCAMTVVLSKECVRVGTSALA